MSHAQQHGHEKHETKDQKPKTTNDVLKEQLDADLKHGNESDARLREFAKTQQAAREKALKQ
jgi:hypothetical protein